MKEWSSSSTVKFTLQCREYNKTQSSSPRRRHQQRCIRLWDEWTNFMPLSMVLRVLFFFIVHNSIYTQAFLLPEKASYYCWTELSTQLSSSSSSSLCINSVGRYRVYKSLISSTTLSLKTSSDDNENLQNHHHLSSLPTTPSSSASSSSADAFTNITPKHVAFICDGNSRWAKKRNLPTSLGHLVGADRLVELLQVLQADGIEYCTLYGFSTENWKRPPSEIRDIFRVMEQTARQWKGRILKDSSTIQIKLLGDLQDTRIPVGLREILEELKTVTDKQRLDGQQKDEEADNHPNATNHQHPKPKKLTVCLAINYGGRQDILQASQKIALAVAAGELTPEDALSEEILGSFLSTAGIPDPDMIIRTSGEYRLSNFLLWNGAYSELYMTDVLWPDFDHDCWKDALSWYQQRERRFGSRSDDGSDDNNNEQASVASTTSAYKRNGVTKTNSSTSS